MSGFGHLCVGCFEDKGTDSVCRSCGFAESGKRSTLFLPFRTVLNQQYVVGRELGKPGGFGITYLSWDRYLGERVAIKEYLPRGLAGRDADRVSVRPHSDTDAEDFRFGVEAFGEEAQTLARFRHDNIVRVRTYVKANDTAYMIMDYYPGETLEEYLGRQGGRVGERRVLQVMAPILEALTSEVHAKHYLHRDISPQNIYLAAPPGAEPSPMLLDFGAARQALEDRSQNLSVILKPGYAPSEQYRHDGKQGPWTDVYACAATLYRAVTGEAPPPAIDRLGRDPLKPPRKLAPDLSPDFCEALLWGMGVDRRRRPQTVEAFRQRLFGRPPEPPSGPATAPILRLLDGELTGQEVPLAEPLIIGRDATKSQLILERHAVSRQHCAVRFDRGRFELEDLDSSNGTFVEQGVADRQLSAGQSTFLEPGERFHLVDRGSRFEVALVAEEPPPEPAGTDSEGGGEAAPEPQQEADPTPTKGCARAAAVIAVLAALAGAIAALVWMSGALN